MEIPFEILHKIENEHEENVASLYSKNFKTWKKYENKKSKLRLVSDYLTNYFSENPTGIISYDKIAKDLNLKKSIAEWHLSTLLKFKCVKKEKINGHEAYFEEKFEHEKPELLHFLLREKYRNVIEYLKDNQ